MSRATDRRVVALEVPAFPVAVERLRWPPLRGRPVLIASTVSGRSPIVSASAEAVAAGVVPGQPVSLARRVCPDAVVVPPDFPTYRAISDDVIRSLGAFSPLYEDAGAGRFFLDVSDTLRRARGFGPLVDMGMRVRRGVADRVGLDALVGVAINKLVSGVAAEEALGHEPLYDVAPGHEARFLAPLAAARLPGVGDRTEQRLLAELNVRRVGQIAAIRVPVLARVFGASARTLHERANGVDWTPVEPGARGPRIVETEILPNDTNDIAVLRAAVTRVVAGVGWQLRHAGRRACSLRLHVTHVDDVDAFAHARLPQACDEGRALTRHAAALLETLAERRVRVRAITLSVPVSIATPAQLDLFAGATPPREAQLTRTLDAIRARFGADAVRLGGAA